MRLDACVVAISRLSAPTYPSLHIACYSFTDYPDGSANRAKYSKPHVVSLTGASFFQIIQGIEKLHAFSERQPSRATVMHLKKISISRYRGIQRMVWHPSPGTNCLIGPADSGKSTILAALSLLLSPFPASAWEISWWKSCIRIANELAAGPHLSRARGW